MRCACQKQAPPDLRKWLKTRNKIGFARRSHAGSMRASLRRNRRSNLLHNAILHVRTLNSELIARQGGTLPHAPLAANAALAQPAEKRASVLRQYCFLHRIRMLHRNSSRRQLNRPRGHLQNFDYPINSGRVSSDLTGARSRSTRPGWPPQLPAGRRQVHAYRQIFLSLSIDIAAHGETDT